MRMLSNLARKVSKLVSIMAYHDWDKHLTQLIGKHDVITNNYQVEEPFDITDMILKCILNYYRQDARYNFINTMNIYFLNV